MKQRMPWPIKVAIKVLIGVAHIDYRILKRARIIEHGRMEDADFSRTVFDRHVAAVQFGQELRLGGALLELGPGDSVATGILGRAAGFSEVILVDAGCFADLRPEAVNRLCSALSGNSCAIIIDPSGPDVAEQLRVQGIRYLTDGVNSLKSLREGGVGHSFSNTVLQHVYRDELPQLVRVLGNLHAVGSYSSHLIKFTDHFSGGFVNRKLPDWVMESSVTKRANLYTNRVSAQEFSDLFESAGFAVRKVAIDFFGTPSGDHAEYHSASDFKSAVGSRPILRAVFLLQRV